VTRAVDRALVRADLGRLPEDFVFDIAKL